MIHGNKNKLYYRKKCLGPNKKSYLNDQLLCCVKLQYFGIYTIYYIGNNNSTISFDKSIDNVFYIKMIIILFGDLNLSNITICHRAPYKLRKTIIEPVFNRSTTRTHPYSTIFV